MALKHQKQAVNGKGARAVQCRHEGLPHDGSDDGVKNLDGVLSRRRDVGAEFEEVRPAIHTHESAGYLVPQFAHADIPLGQVVVEWHGEILGESEDVVRMLMKSGEEVDGFGLGRAPPAAGKLIQPDAVFGESLSDDSGMLRLDFGDGVRSELQASRLPGRLCRVVRPDKKVDHASRPFLSELLMGHLQLPEEVGDAEAVDEVLEGEVRFPEVVDSLAFEQRQQPDGVEGLGAAFVVDEVVTQSPQRIVSSA